MGVYRDGHRVPDSDVEIDATDPAAARRHIDQLKRDAHDQGGYVWLSLPDPSHQEVSVVADTFGLDPLLVDDSTSPQQRAKVEYAPDHLFVLLKILEWVDETSDVETGQIACFIGDDYAISVRHGSGLEPSAARDRLEDNPAIATLGPIAVFWAVADVAVDETEDQRTLIQSDIEEIAAEFKAAVLARGRQIPDAAMEGQSFSARNAQRLNLAGMVRDREEVAARLRSLHGQVDTRSSASTAMKTTEEQLSEALARIQTLEADAKAREGLMADASAQIETFKATLQTREQEHQALLQQVCTERDTLKGQLIAVQADVDRLTKHGGELETQVRDLQSREQDLEKRAAIKAAQIAASMGTQVPARITPSGDSKPATAAEVWNRQFAKA